jgi:uncharacterized protein YneF (UPF0154 family)
MSMARRSWDRKGVQKFVDGGMPQYQGQLLGENPAIEAQKRGLMQGAMGQNMPQYQRQLLGENPAIEAQKRGLMQGAMGQNMNQYQGQLLGENPAIEAQKRGLMQGAMRILQNALMQGARPQMNACSRRRQSYGSIP